MIPASQDSPHPVPSSQPIPITMTPNPLPWLLIPLSLIPTTAAASSPSAGPVPDRPEGPRISFESTVFDFGQINNGDSVTHSFVFTNTGDRVLEITRVQPGCGCTTAGTWDQRVEPGAKGSIPLRFNSTGFSGKVTKTATVHCNDAAHSNVVLQLTGTIWKPIETTPSLVMFSYGEEGQSRQTRTVRIVNNLEGPVELSGLSCTNTSFRAELETVKPGREFLLHVTAEPPFSARSTVATIRLATSSPKNPSVQVTAYAVVQPAVAVSPEQVWIPGDALVSPLKSTLVVRNAGPDPLRLSDLETSLPGLGVSLRESEPGRLYQIEVNFPTGFRLEEGRTAEIRVRSNHPRFPLLRIPVLQQPGSRTVSRKQTGI